MKLFKKQKEGNNSIILFFNGWGMDHRCLSHLIPEDKDIIIFYDYRGDIELPSLDLSAYDSVYVVAWSMGVWVANQLVNHLEVKPDKMIAFCGSPYPVNDSYGIPVKVFDLTVKGLEKAGTEKFFKRMLVGLDNTAFIKPERHVEEQIDELKNLKIKSLESEIRTVNWDKVIIAEKDMIFPLAALKEYWGKCLRVELLNSPHYPFDTYNNWEKILNI